MQSENRDSEYTLYCDESGNTGQDTFKDVNQPFYALGGLYISASDATACRELVRKALSTNGNKSELKGATLMGSGQGRLVAWNLLQGLAKLGANLIYVLVEKRYALAGRFVDEFLDPVVNIRVGDEYCVNPFLMQKAANKIFQLKTDALQSLEKALREESVDNRAYAVQVVANALFNINEFNLANLAFGYDRKLDTLDRPGFTKEEARLFRLGKTPNVAAFTVMLANFEVISMHNSFNFARVIHDETSSMEEVLQSYANMMYDADFANRSESWRPIAFPLLRHIDKVQFVRSHDELLIQAADVMAASVTYLARAIHNKKALDSLDLALSRLILSDFCDLHLPTAHLVVSEHFMCRFREHIQALN